MYAADRLKLILWSGGGAIEDSLSMSNLVPCGIIPGVIGTGLPWHTNQCQGINHVSLCYSYCGKSGIQYSGSQSIQLLKTLSNPSFI